MKFIRTFENYEISDRMIYSIASDMNRDVANGELSVDDLSKLLLAYKEDKSGENLHKIKRFLGIDKSYMTRQVNSFNIIMDLHFSK